MNTDNGDSGSAYYVKRYNPDFDRYTAEVVVAAHSGYESRGIAAHEIADQGYTFP